jgi:hypothetical protein
MKAVTKAKRRATLSVCGLGFLDETEVQDIPDCGTESVAAISAPASAASAAGTPPRKVLKKDTRPLFIALQGEIDAETSCRSLQEWHEAAVPRIATLPEDWQHSIRRLVEGKAAALEQNVPFCSGEFLSDQWADRQVASMQRSMQPVSPAADVVWDEDGERPATGGESIAAIDHTDVGGIPRFLRNAVAAARPSDVDEKFWLANLTVTFNKLETIPDLTRVYAAQVKPQRGRVSAETFAAAERIARETAGRIAFKLEAA